jgi:hypothetical protein
MRLELSLNWHLSSSKCASLYIPSGDRRSHVLNYSIFTHLLLQYLRRTIFLLLWRFCCECRLGVDHQGKLQNYSTFFQRKKPQNLLIILQTIGLVHRQRTRYTLNLKDQCWSKIDLIPFLYSCPKYFLSYLI